MSGTTTGSGGTATIGGGTSTVSGASTSSGAASTISSATAPPDGAYSLSSVADMIGKDQPTTLVGGTDTITGGGGNDTTTGSGTEVMVDTPDQAAARRLVDTTPRVTNVAMTEEQEQAMASSAAATVSGATKA